MSYELAHQFLAMIRQHTPNTFEPWLQRCAASNVAELQTFAAGLQQDRAAVVAALTELWSTGPVEGHINRLKLVKRQMFGRANFDVLKQRVLPCSVTEHALCGRTMKLGESQVDLHHHPRLLRHTVVAAATTVMLMQRDYHYL